MAHRLISLLCEVSGLDIEFCIQKRIRPLGSYMCGSALGSSTTPIRPDPTRHEDTTHNACKQIVRCVLYVDEKTFSRNDGLTRRLRVMHPEVSFTGQQSIESRHRPKANFTQKYATRTLESGSACLFLKSPGRA